jgi:hypothetical protein
MILRATSLSKLRDDKAGRIRRANPRRIGALWDAGYQAIGVTVQDPFVQQVIKDAGIAQQ